MLAGKSRDNLLNPVRNTVAAESRGENNKELVSLRASILDFYTAFASHTTLMQPDLLALCVLVYPKLVVNRDTGLVFALLTPTDSV